MSNRCLKGKQKAQLFVLLLSLSACTSAPKVAPLQTEKTYQHIQFGSCNHPRLPQPIWSVALKNDPEVYIHLGDMIYSYTPDDRPRTKMYAMQAQVPEFKAYRAKTPLIGTWDDYDFGQNDGGKDNPEKDIAKKEFLEFFANDAAAMDPGVAGLYHAFMLGPKERRVHIIVLDTRYYRDALERDPAKPAIGPYMPTKDPKKTLLGETQWAWLKEELKKPAALTIIASSIQFIPQEHGFEKWGNFPHEREKLRALLSRAASANIVVISGDRHHGEISKMEVGRRAVYEVTASGINRVSNIENENNAFRVGPRIMDNNFGEIDIDWQNKTAELKLIDVKGQTRSSVALKLL
jgi:alkaline phosphatase D